MTPRTLLFTRIAGLLLSLGCLTNGGCQDASHNSPAAQRDVWRFAIEESEGSVQHAYALQFKQLIEDRTDGQVEVRIYPYGTLGTSTQITEQLNMGVLELAMASPGSLGKFIPEMQVFLLHYVLPPEERQIQSMLSDTTFLSDFDQWYAPKGLKLLSMFSEGEMVWTMKKEVRSPEDFRGLKMRVMTSPILLAAYQAYGASPTPMPYSEVYSGLQLNMIDGQVNPIFAIERQKFYEVTSWLIFPNHTSFITSCAANREFFDSLPPPRQRLLEDVMQELDVYIFDVQARLQSERLKTILQEKKRKHSPLNICGDIDGFVDSLTAEERLQLIDDNQYLKVFPGLSSDQRAAFEKASLNVRELYLQLGGSGSRQVLERLLEYSHSQPQLPPTIQPASSPSQSPPRSSTAP